MLEFLGTLCLLTGVLVMTLVGLFLLLLVNPHMAVQVEFGEEATTAVVAKEPLLSLVDLHVLVQVGFLGEAEVASLKLALVGLFVGVNPQMVEEVMPFSEYLPTVSVLAL